MPTKDVFQPKQQRSQDTQRKLIEALHFCLKDKFFEHINIKELAEHAGVSVGTFYRRFKNKESLLPLLYQDFGNDLDAWVTSLEHSDYRDLADAVTQMTEQAYEFLNGRKSVFRTLHLNSRLHTEILDSDDDVDRKVIYQRLAAILVKFDDEIVASNKTEAAELVVYTLITNLLDKVLYPTLTPAVATSLDGKALALEMPKMLLAYLK